MPMSEKHKAFCKAYAGEHNAASAARAAGYSDDSAANTGCRLLKNKDIQDEIARIEQKISLKAESARILSVIEIQQELSRIALDDDRKDQDRLRALELLGKAKGLFVERSEVTTVETPEAIKGMTMEQLRDLVSATKPS